MGDYQTDEYALWLDFRMLDEIFLHMMLRGVGSMGERTTLQIEKKAEAAGVLKEYIYLIMDAQLHIQNGAFASAIH